jgi:hypothetical protein
MHHTPWFRFPFFAVMQTYASVLMQETSVVAARLGGYAAAIATNGFLTDFIPGIVMGLVFAQMALLAQPLCLALGAANNESNFVEELVATAPQDFNWGGVDARITPLRQLGVGLWLLRVPTFKPLTEVLSKLSQHVACSLLLISGHAVVQVKVIAQTGVARQVGALRSLGSGAEHLAGTARLFDFSMPHVGGPLPALQAAFSVEVPHLLAMLRFCQAEALETQVYDYN